MNILHFDTTNYNLYFSFLKANQILKSVEKINFFFVVLEILRSVEKKNFFFIILDTKRWSSQQMMLNFGK